MTFPYHDRHTRLDYTRFFKSYLKEDFGYENTLATTIYNIAHGVPVNVTREQINKARKKYIKLLGEEYNPIDFELLEMI